MGKSTRQFRRESDRKYLYLVVGTLIIVGGGLIALIFGIEALLTAIPCLIGAAAAITVPWLILAGIEKWRIKSEKKYMNPAEPVVPPNIERE